MYFRSVFLVSAFAYKLYFCCCFFVIMHAFYCAAVDKGGANQSEVEHNELYRELL